MTRKIIFDCDPGLDDALALLIACASDEFDILAVTTIAGNSTIDNTTQNALNLLEFYGRPDIPVARGSANPILYTFSFGEHVHGASGIGGIEFPKAKREADPRRAHDMIRDLLLKSDTKVTIIATGPLTNLGIALTLYPEIKDKIEFISIMGGTIGIGNVSAVAEANIYNDPEAADIVFKSGIPIAMFGLNVTYATQVYPSDMDRIEGINSELAKIASGFLRNHHKFYQRLSYFVGDPSHDSCAVVYLLKPEIFNMEHLNVVIDLTGQYSRGQTIIDQHGVTGRQANAMVALFSHREAYVDFVYKSIKKLSEKLEAKT
jgi:pyrimidine-specific ribonucleoside hydrolase